MKFFAWLNDQQQGPFEEEAIKEMLSKKQIAHHKYFIRVHPWLK
jgi:hypothetical protein